MSFDAEVRSRTLKKDIFSLCGHTTCPQSRCWRRHQDMCATLHVFFDSHLHVRNVVRFLCEVEQSNTPAHMAAMACRTRCEILLEHTWPTVQGNSTRGWHRGPNRPYSVHPNHQTTNGASNNDTRSASKTRGTWNMKCSVR